MHTNSVSAILNRCFFIITYRWYGFRYIIKLQTPPPAPPLEGRGERGRLSAVLPSLQGEGLGWGLYSSFSRLLSFVRKTRCKSKKNISFAKRNSRIIIEAVQYFFQIPRCSTFFGWRKLHLLSQCNFFIPLWYGLQKVLYLCAVIQNKCVPLQTKQLTKRSDYGIQQSR